MQFLYGVLSTAAFFVCLFLAFKMGQRRTPTPAPATDDEKRKSDKMRKDFQALFNYDVTTALHRKKVT